MIKRCKQCGADRDLNEFRPYYNRPSGRNSTCKECEKINSRYKYLTAKVTDVATSPELAAIERLYAAQRQAGLKPPVTRNSKSGFDTDWLDKLCAAVPIVSVEIPTDAPFELTRWLTEPLDNTTPDNNDKTYEELKIKYAPIIGRDAAMLPIRDKKYASVLSKIAARFDSFEEQCYKEEEEDE